MPVLIALFILYVVVSAYQMRRALATQEPRARLVEAKRLLFTTFLGVPLLVGFIIMA
ncbi:MAG: hypothetical protein M0R73_10405 [Dehalococcoidia bacterium]|nr:hypothetical protein [Dehalococcoidia bacterium]